MAGQYRFNHGLRFSNNLEAYVLKPLMSLRGKGSTLLAIDGVQSSGKTSLAVELIEYIEDREIDYENQLALGGEELVKKAIVCHQLGYKSIIYDEAADFGNMSQMSKFNSNLFQFFNRNRALNLIIVLCLPYVRSLDPRIDGVANISCFVHIWPNFLNPDNPKRAFSVYDIKSLAYLRHNTQKFYNKMPWEAYNKLVPVFEGQFFRLAQEQDVKLQKISTEQKIKAASEIFKPKETRRGNSED